MGATGIEPTHKPSRPDQTFGEVLTTSQAEYRLCVVSQVRRSTVGNRLVKLEAIGLVNEAQDTSG